jgi:hypothetical protein
MTGATGPTWMVTSLLYNQTGLLTLNTTAGGGGPLVTNYGAWLTTGNAGTSPTTNYIGTNDANDFAVFTNGAERMRVIGAGGTPGLVGINTTAPTTYLEVNSKASTTVNAIFGHSNNVGAFVGYDNVFSIGVLGQGSGVESTNGSGIFATNPTAGYTSVFAQSTGAATVAAAIEYSNVWIANYAKVDNSSSTYNPGAVYGELNVTSATLGGNQSAVVGTATNYAAGKTGLVAGGLFAGTSTNQEAVGVWGQGVSNAGVAGTGKNPSQVGFVATDAAVGGYFQGFNAAGTLGNYAYVGGLLDDLACKIEGGGTVSEIIPTPSHGRITLTCPESPEYWYTDYGSVKMVNGFAHVELDNILSDIIFINDSNPMRVFCTPVHMYDFNGVTVDNQSTTGFDLIELNGGKHTGQLDYQVVVKPRTNYGSGRFFQAPGPAWLDNDKEPEAARAANQIDPKKIYHWEPDFKVYNYNPEDVIPVGNMIPAGPHIGKYKLGDGKYADGLPVNRDKIKSGSSNAAPVK